MPGEEAAAASSSGGSSAALAGAASIGGGLLGGLLDFPIQKSFVTKQSRHQRKWAEYMSNTQYQRAVADLRAAGLNPALAYTQGGAGYSGYQQAESPDVDVEIDPGQAVSSAKAAQSYRLELERMRQDVRRATAEADFSAHRSSRAREYVEAEIEGLRSGVERNVASADEAKQGVILGKQTQKIREADEASAAAIEKLRETKPGEYLLILREILRDVGAR